MGATIATEAEIAFPASIYLKRTNHWNLRTFAGYLKRTLRRILSYWGPRAFNSIKSPESHWTPMDKQTLLFC
jgi:hypothetical protein